MINSDPGRMPLPHIKKMIIQLADEYDFDGVLKLAQEFEKMAD